MIAVYVEEIIQHVQIVVMFQMVMGQHVMVCVVHVMMLQVV